MKYGVRKPNIKKSIKARTTGKVKRKLKKAVNPLYGKKGMGVINNPKKAVYNAVYNRTTISVSDIARDAITAKTCVDASAPRHASKINSLSPKSCNIYGTIFIILGIILAFLGLLLLLIAPLGGAFAVLFGVLSVLLGRKYKKMAK